MFENEKHNITDRSPPKITLYNNVCPCELVAFKYLNYDLLRIIIPPAGLYHIFCLEKFSHFENKKKSKRFVIDPYDLPRFINRVNSVSIIGK